MYIKKRFEDTKWVIRSSKSKKDRQYNDQQGKKRKDKRLLKNKRL